MKSSNVVFVFGDQWRAQAAGYAGNEAVQTPNLDRLAAEGVNVTHALAGCPVCSPYRASLMSGQFPLTHGVFVNDVCLAHRAPSLADTFAAAGYARAYIGKWHIDGHGRSNYIPPERRQGFEYWKVLECTHDYNHSAYYAGDSAEKRYWDGYDAIAQTRDAQAYIRNRDRDSPFLLCLSWGGPHAPYDTAPDEYRALYAPDKIGLRPNVPDSVAEEARRNLAGYYAHCSALDDCVGMLRATLREEGIAEDTLFVFTSDHGDMLGSQGERKKQRPWEESIRVPFLLYGPSVLGPDPREVAALLDAPDIMPTLLGLCGLEIPDTVEGLDYSECLRGGPDPSDGAALLMCPHPFGQFARKGGGREWRGLRTRRHTYVRDMNGPWLLYDNEADPYQQRNLVRDPAAADLRVELDARLDRKLAAHNDAFLHGDEYIRKWGYRVNANGTVPYLK